MKRPGFGRTRLAGLAAVAAVASVLAGCASASSTQEPSAPAATSSLATSLAAAGGEAWAVVAVGGSASSENKFWELLTRPAASSQWKLVTPPGIADNGGLVAAAPAAGQRLDIAVRPDQGLTFSPLALTGDGGNTWDTGLVDAAVAAVPDAFASGGGKMLALLTNGTIEQAAAPGSNWTRLATPGSLATSAAGRHCQVTELTGVALTASGTPLAAASCVRPGVVGIFTRPASAWESAGLTLGGQLAGKPVQVLRLTGTSAGTVALLQAGAGSTADLLAAWSSDGTHWTVSAPAPAGSGPVRASGTGADGAVWLLLASGHAVTVSGPGAAWRVLPTPPRGTAALAPVAGGTFDALAVSGAKLTVFRLGADGAWRQDQVLNVPIQYGSSS
ncbi:MAG TPA: hypothetical protein VKG80_10620 [Trebonia sp.]|nr:hypothetical protein [Trebonia sp.]